MLTLLLCSMDFGESPSSFSQGEKRNISVTFSPLGLVSLYHPKIISSFSVQFSWPFFFLMDHSSKPSFPTPFSPLFVLKHLLRGPIPLLSPLAPQTLDSVSAVQGAASRKLWRRWTQTSMEVYAKQECPPQRRSWTLTGIAAEQKQRKQRQCACTGMQFAVGKEAMGK